MKQLQVAQMHEQHLSRRKAGPWKTVLAKLQAEISTLKDQIELARVHPGQFAQPQSDEVARMSMLVDAARLERQQLQDQLLHAEQAGRRNRADEERSKLAELQGELGSIHNDQERMQR